MPANLQMKRCIAWERGALAFRSPDSLRIRPGARVQILDVFSLKVATGYTRDLHGRLLLQAQPSLAAGRSWSLAKAAQLIRNDARPHRWVTLQQDRRAWVLFWAGGGLQYCRDLLAAETSGTDPSGAQESSALVPVTPEALLRVLLDLEAAQPGAPLDPPDSRSWWCGMAANPWMVLAGTSLAWLLVLGITVAAFLEALDRKDRQLELLLERTAPASQGQ